MMRGRQFPDSGGNGTWAVSRRWNIAAALGLGLAVLSTFAVVETTAQQSKASQGFINPNTTAREDKAFGAVKPGTSIAGPVRKGDKTTPLLLNADELEYDTRNNRVIAKGNVEIFYADNALRADRVVYDQNTNILTAEGNAKLQQPDGAIVRGDKLVTTADFAEAFFQSLSLVGKDDTRIVARRAIRRDGNIIEFEQGKFTPCKTEGDMPPLWCIAAQRIVHDKDKQTITYQDAQLEFLGTPIVPLPFFQHADPSVKSKSGFLIPEFDASSRFGFAAHIPYHFALNPSYDFLFHPMFTSKYGVLWQGDWRQKVRAGNVAGTFNVKLAGIDQGSESDINPDLRERFRGSVQTSGRFSLSSWWSFGWDIIGETDRAFRNFYKLDGNLTRDRVNTAFIAGMNERNYLGLTMYHTGGLVLNPDLNTVAPNSNLATVTPNLSQAAASRVLPVFDYNYIFGQPVAGGELKMNMNAISYWQDLNVIDPISARQRLADSNTNRVTASIAWRRTLTDTIGQTYTPFLSLRGDIISFRDTIDPTTRLLQSDEETVTRGVATAGLTYAYPWMMATNSASHTVEPVAQVIARQRSVEQRRLPDLDSRSQVFDDMNLFEDKTAGYDRIDTGVRANYGLQYTVQAFTGGSLRVLAGQSYHLGGDNIFRNPGLDSDGRQLYSPASGLQNSASDYVLGVYLSPFNGFRAVSQTRFDEDTRSLRRADALVGWNFGPFTTQASYAYTAASPALNLAQDQQEILGLVGVRLTDRWSVYGQMRYSIDTNKPLQDIVQLRYADDCFVVTTSYIETRITDLQRNILPDRTLMLRVEFKYLGEFRQKTNVLDSVFGDNQPNPQQ